MSFKLFFDTGLENVIVFGFILDYLGIISLQTSGVHRIFFFYGFYIYLIYLYIR